MSFFAFRHNNQQLKIKLLVIFPTVFIIYCLAYVASNLCIFHFFFSNFLFVCILSYDSSYTNI